MTDVVVTGVGAVTPLGLGAPALFERWAAGEVGIADGQGRCREFDPTDHLSVKDVEALDEAFQTKNKKAGPVKLKKFREILEAAHKIHNNDDFGPDSAEYGQKMLSNALFSFVCLSAPFSY